MTEKADISKCVGFHITTKSSEFKTRFYEFILHRNLYLKKMRGVAFHDMDQQNNIKKNFRNDPIKKTNSNILYSSIALMITDKSVTSLLQSVLCSGYEMTTFLIVIVNSRTVPYMDMHPYSSRR